MQYFLSFLGIAVGTLLVWKTFALTNIFGKISWAERNLGSGGTYALYKFIGIIVVILSIMYLLGLLDLLLFPFRNLFGGVAGR